MINQFYFIGFGAVATALVEIMNLENDFFNIPFVIIEPKDIAHPELFKNRFAEHIQVALTKDNYKELLKDCDENTIVIDLSIDVDSIMMLECSKEKGFYYINASIENYVDENEHRHGTDLTYDDIKNDTLFHRQLIVDKLLKGTRKTRLVNFSINPCGIQQFFKRGIREYAKMKGVEFNDGNYAKLCNELGLERILLSEYDSQKTNLKPNKNLGLNTWGVSALCLESADESVIVLNNDDLEYLEDKGVKLIKPDEGDIKANNIRFLTSRGMNGKDESYYLDSNGNHHKYSGFLISHAEITSLGQFLQYKKNTPTIMYIYRVCDVAEQTLDLFRKNNYKPLQNNYVLENKDILPNGFDSIGALMIFENGDKLWCGTVLTIEQVRKLGLKIAQPTTTQAGAFVYAGVKFIINNPNEGLNEGETVSRDELFKYVDKYMGNIFCKLI
jgi:homospermidine synthase